MKLKGREFGKLEKREKGGERRRKKEKGKEKKERRKEAFMSNYSNGK
jgi:hypothetical protein